MAWPFKPRGGAARASHDTLPRAGRQRSAVGAAPSSYASENDFPAENSGSHHGPGAFAAVLRWVGRACLLALGLGLLAGLAVGGFYVHHFIYKTHYFQVRQVRITGAGEELEREARDWLTAKLTTESDNLVKLRRPSLMAGLTRLPRAKQVRVHKIYPDTLQVSFTERKPVLVAKLKQPWLMDNEGVLLAPLTAREVAQSKLPLLTGLDGADVKAGSRVGSPRLAELLETVAFVRASDPVLREQIEAWHIEGRDNIIATLRSGTEVRFGSEPLLERLPHLAAALTQKRELAGAKYIDLRMEKQLVYHEGQP